MHDIRMRIWGVACGWVVGAPCIPCCTQAHGPWLNDHASGRYKIPDRVTQRLLGHSRSYCDFTVYVSLVVYRYVPFVCGMLYVMYEVFHFGTHRSYVDVAMRYVEVMYLVNVHGGIALNCYSVLCYQSHSSNSYT